MTVRLRAGCIALATSVVARAMTASAQHHHHHHHAPAAAAPSEAAPPAADTAPVAEPAPAEPAPVAAAPAHVAPAPRHAVAVARVTTRTVVVVAPAPAPLPSPESPPARPVALDIGVGIRAVSRHLSFNQDLNAQFQPYDLWIAPAAALAIEWFPGAHFTRGFLAHIGVYAAGDYVFGIASRDHNGNTYDAVSYQYGGGLRIRIPLPLGASEIGVLAGYEGQTFTNQPASMTAATTYVALSTAYQALRGGLSLRLALGSRLTLLASGGVMDVLSAGDELRGYFPRATVAAVDVSAGVAVTLGAGFEVRALLEARRYFFAMNPDPGDAYIVGGALDHYLGGSFFVAWRH